MADLSQESFTSLDQLSDSEIFREIEKMRVNPESFDVASFLTYTQVLAQRNLDKKAKLLEYLQSIGNTSLVKNFLLSRINTLYDNKKSTDPHTRKKSFEALQQNLELAFTLGLDRPRLEGGVDRNKPFSGYLHDLDKECRQALGPRFGKREVLAAVAGLGLAMVGGKLAHDAAQSTTNKVKEDPVLKHAFEDAKSTPLNIDTLFPPTKKDNP